MTVERTALEFAYRATVLKLLREVPGSNTNQIADRTAEFRSGGQADCGISDDVSQTEPELVARQWVGKSGNCGLTERG